MPGRILSISGVTGVLIALIGLVLLSGGGWLVALGGAPIT
jgi:glucose dehydrogenase